MCAESYIDQALCTHCGPIFLVVLPSMGASLVGVPCGCSCRPVTLRSRLGQAPCSCNMRKRAASLDAVDEIEMIDRVEGNKLKIKTSFIKIEKVMTSSYRER